MSKFWILVSDSNHARLFTADKASGPVAEVEDFIHPEARLHSREITSDLPGKQHDSGPSGHHAVEPKSDAHQYEGVEFARELAGYLGSNLADKKFESLMLVCDPGFLGKLRHELDEQVKKHVRLEVTKNLVKHSLEDIRAHLPTRLPI